MIYSAADARKDTIEYRTNRIKIHNTLVKIKDAAKLGLGRISIEYKEYEGSEARCVQRYLIEAGYTVCSNGDYQDTNFSISWI